jgi:ABC-type sugar transport system ATPase subunit
VQQVGPPLEVYQRPANLFTAGFLGSPPMNQVRGRVVQRDGLWFENPDQDLRLRVPEGAASLPPGREVVLGLRPEALLITPTDPDFEGVVEEIEPLGHELLITVRAGALPVILRCEAGQAVTLGKDVGIAVARGGHHWFDATTEERLAG